ncbi:MAG TPA: SulP family inorganic anion transporter, partial [Ilumatobacteraceae bacterium]|nr:SulP family inorganic anion transporter [Ilumatobacteraceae bacterium]
AVFGGSNVQVSGPTGAMTVVLVPIVARHGTDAVLVVAIMAGALIVAAGLAGLGRFLAYVPWPVIEGFTVGIACIIFLQQVPAALGVPKPDAENTLAAAVRAVAEAIDGAGSVESIMITITVIVIMVATPSLHRSAPASLIAVVVATVITSGTTLDVAVIGNLPNSLPMPSLPSTSVDEVRTLFGAAVAVAMLAAIESLLSARVADGMSGHSRHDPDRELIGQGLANLASPLFGGMPATGAIARTAVNVRAGAHTRVAAVVHALMLAVIVYVGGSVMARIPLAALAGVLMVTAVRMVERHNVRAVLRATRSDAVVMVITATVTLAADLILAVEVGVAVAAVLALRQIARTTAAHSERVPSADDGDADRAALADHIAIYRFDGAIFFGAAQRFLTELTSVSDVRVVIMRLDDVQVLDATGAHALGEIVSELQDRRITVLICSARAEHQRTLRAVGAIDRLVHHRHLFADLESAIEHAHVHVERVVITS